MHYRKPYYYSNFKCIADKCPATCCEGWGIVIDDKTMSRYNKLTESDKEYVFSHINADESMFKKCGNRCSFLNDNKLCDLYTRLGESGFCNTCRRYPRHFEEYGNLIEASLSISCPVAAEMIIANSDCDKYISYSNNKISPLEGEVDPILLGGLLEVRQHIFDIMNNRSISLTERLKRAYHYSAKIQNIVYNYEALGRRVKKTSCIAEFLLKIDALTKKEIIHANKITNENHILDYSVSQHRQENMLSLIDIVMMLENINDEWPAMIDQLKRYLYEDMCNKQYIELSKEFNKYMSNREYEYEHIFNYFIYTYYLGGVYDYNVHSMAKLAIISVAIIRDLGLLLWIKSGKNFSVEDQVRICYTYSRQIEHSDDNLLSIEGLLNAHPKLSDKNIISMFC